MELQTLEGRSKRRHIYHAHHALPDTADGRDRLYRPRAAHWPRELPLQDFLPHARHIIDQGAEHVCTGVALAVTANYMLRRHRPYEPLYPVSARMLYEMARRYDGVTEPHEGSTARGAIKGWRKHGVCGEELWPFHEFDTDRALRPDRERDAKRRPVGAYWRVTKQRVDLLRAAIAEHGVVYVTTKVHEGWHNVGPDGRIPFRTDGKPGAHAVVLVGYDRHGFWLQNSKGEAWGRGGFGRLSDEDWVMHAQDAWVVELPEAR